MICIHGQKGLTPYKNPSLSTQARRLIKTPQRSPKPNNENKTHTSLEKKSVGLFGRLTLHLGTTLKLNDRAWSMLLFANPWHLQNQDEKYGLFTSKKININWCHEIMDTSIRFPAGCLHFPYPEPIPNYYGEKFLWLGVPQQTALTPEINLSQYGIEMKCLALKD